MRRIFILGSLCMVGLALLGLGCGTDRGTSGPPPSAVFPPQPTGVPPLPPGVTLHKDNDIQGIWLAPGFNFHGYDTLYIEESEYRAVKRDNEEGMRKFAIASLQKQFQEAALTTGLFKTVVTSSNDIAAGSRCLRLHNIIVEYEKGGGGARYWAGEFGAGQPVIKVRGLMYDGDTLVFVFEARRSGESGYARVYGGFMSDQHVQSYDIHDLTFDMADCLRRNAGLPPNH